MRHSQSGMSKHIITKSNKIVVGYVDAAGIGRRLFILPGEKLLVCLNQRRSQQRSQQLQIRACAQREQHRRSHKTAKDQTLSRFKFNKEVQIKLASLILNEAGCNWCKERLYLYLTNRRIRDPYVRWCERRTSSLTSGEAVYSIVRAYYLLKLNLSNFYNDFSLKTFNYKQFCKCSSF